MVQLEIFLALLILTRLQEIKKRAIVDIPLKFPKLANSQIRQQCESPKRRNTKMAFIIIFHSKMCFQQFFKYIYLHNSNLSKQREPEQGLQRGLFSGEQSESLFAVRRLMESFYEKFEKSSRAQLVFVEHLLQYLFCQKQSDWLKNSQK